jgi:hypothetical protein
MSTIMVQSASQSGVQLESKCSHSHLTWNRLSEQLWARRSKLKKTSWGGLSIYWTPMEIHKSKRPNLSTPLSKWTPRWITRPHWKKQLYCSKLLTSTIMGQSASQSGVQLVSTCSRSQNWTWNKPLEQLWARRSRHKNASWGGPLMHWMPMAIGKLKRKSSSPPLSKWTPRWITRPHWRKQLYCSKLLTSTIMGQSASQSGVQLVSTCRSSQNWTWNKPLEQLWARRSRHKNASW